MLSHAEAQALISARFDGALDPVAERVLNAHIATCPSCRAFNQSVGQLAHGLRHLPYLPASPAVSRAVLEHVSAPRAPWSRLGVPSLSTMMPALAAAVVALVLVAAGAFAFIQVNDDGPEPASLNAPSAQSTREVAQSNPTATDPPTASVSITIDESVQPPAANPPDPTATATARANETESGIAPTTAPDTEETEAPDSPDDAATRAAATQGADASSDDTTGGRAGDEEPSATADPGENTALSDPEEEATSTQAPPTATATAEPAATDAPTQTEVPAATDVPQTETEVPTATEAPTATDVPPTETEGPTATAEPTATDVPPTETEIPTATAEPTATDVPPTETEIPTATAEPTVEPTATASPTQESAAAGIPTEAATATPEPTATATVTPEPTSTATPELTATATVTPEPTSTATPEPTATEVPTLEPTETLEPTSPPIESQNGTVIQADDPDETPEDDATEETAPSGNVGGNLIATIVPTEDGREPAGSPVQSQDETVTPVDRATEPPVDDATEEPAPPGNEAEDIIASIVPTEDDETVTPDVEQDNSESGDGDESPPIGPSDGTTPVPVDDGTLESSTEEASAESGDGDGGDGDDSDDDNSGPGNGDGDDNDNSGRGNGDGDDNDNSGPGNGDGADDDGTATDRPTDAGEGDGAGLSLTDATVYQGGPAAPGDPDSRLGLSASGDPIFSPFPGRLSLAEDGLTLSAAPGPAGQAVFACNDAGACLNATSPSATGPHQDTPLGWLSRDDLVYQRIDESAASPVQYRAVRFDPASRELLADEVLGDGGFGLASLLRPYPVADGFLVLTESSWLRIDGSGLTVLDANPYGAGVALLRVQPALGELSYVAGGELITASVAAPGTPLTQVPFRGDDYDRSPDGERFVLSDGDELRIVRSDGTPVTTIANPEGITIGPVAWLAEGIVFVDAATGELQVIDPGD